MKKGIVFNTKSCYELLISRDIINQVGLKEVSEINYEFARKQSNGEYVIVSEHEIASELLKEGKGIVYKGYVIFGAEAIEDNLLFDMYQSAKSTKEGEYKSYLNGIVFENISNLFLFPIVKSIISLYEKDIIDKDGTFKKLSKYLPQNAIEFILNETEIQLAG